MEPSVAANIASIEGYRLSPQQQRLWPLWRVGGAYGASIVVALSGDLSPEALHRALLRAVGRHEVLRTHLRTFPSLALPLQVVGEAEVDWQVLESAVAGPGRSEPVSALLSRGRQNGASLESGPRLCARLAPLAPGEHLLLLSLPAFCCDGSSLNLLAAEVLREAAGGVEAPPPAMQAIDASEWQNDLLDSGEGAEHWQRQEVSALTGWRLPFQAVPAAPATHAGTTAVTYQPQEMPLPAGAADASDAAERLAAACDAPVSTVLLAAWQALLGRLAGVRRLAVGAAFDGRGYEELSGAIGLFARYLPVSLDLDLDRPFREQVARTAAACDEAEQWQESFSWERFLGGHGLAAGLPAAFRFEGAAARLEVGVPGLRAEVAGRWICFERCALELIAERAASGLALSLRFDPALLPRLEIERLAGQLLALLNSAAAAPDAPLGDLDLLNAEERQELLQGFNRTEAPRDGLWLHRAFSRRARQSPAAGAVVGAGRTLSYADLEAGANRLARRLGRLGVGPDAPVAVALPRSPDLPLALLAVLKAGGAYLPLDGAQPRERLAWMLADSRARVLVTGPGFSGDLPDFGGVTVDLARDREGIAEERSDDPAVEVAGDHLAYVLYTSGSTGRPKGVMVSHRGLTNYLAWALATYPVAEGRGAPVHSPIGFDLTVTSLFLPLLAGGTAVLIDEEQGLGGLAETLAESGFSLVKLTPAHLEGLSELLPVAEAARSTRSLVLGGEPLAGERLAAWRRAAPGLRIFNEYGPTETVVGCCVYEQPPGEVASGPVPIGRPIANTRLYVLDERRRPVPVWVPGELWIGGAGLARGYLGRPDLTAERFVPDPFGGEGARLYRTGDRVRHRPDGNLEFLGRADHQVKIRGHRIELGEVEAVLAEHPRVRECAVVASEEHGGRRLVAYVAADGEPARGPELRGFLEERLPAYMIPALFVPLAALPLTANGKVDRRALPAPGVHHRDLDQAWVPPQGPTEELLADVWREVLGIDRVGADDNFFALGGDSIRSIQVRSEAEKRGLHLTVQQMFQHPTLRALAKSVRQGTESPAAEERVPPFGLLSEEDRGRLPADAEDAFPLALLQSGMLFHSELNPRSAIYHDIYSFHLHGPLDLPALRASLARLAARHPALRTGFHLSGWSEPLQIVHRAVEVPLSVADLDHLAPPEQEAEVAAWLEGEKHRPFDWRRPPLLRVQVHRRGERSFQLGVGFHHVILDGWSLAALFSELLRVYLALVAQEAPPAEPAPELSYRDFVAAERRALQSEESRRYWAGVVADGVGTLLPRRGGPERARGADEREIRHRFVTCPPEVSDGLKGLSRELGVPLKSVLLAAHLRVLALLSGEVDVVTGLVTNSRPEEEGGERVLGLYLNTLPLRLRLAGGTWAELVRETFGAEREALPHRRFPLFELQRMAGGTAPFEVVFNFMHFHVYQTVGDLRGLDVVGSRTFEEANFPFAANFWLDSADSPVQLGFDYDALEIGPDQIEEIARYYERILAALAADPAARYEHPAPFAPDERQALLALGAGDPAQEAAECIDRRFAAQAARTPKAVAIAFEEDPSRCREVTYGELETRANRLARRLVALGVGPEAPVGLCLPRSPELIEGILGILKAGGCYLPLDPAYPAERIDWLLADAGVRVAVTLEPLAPLLSIAGRGIELVLLDRDRSALETENDEPLPPRALPDHPVYVIYTSGSTGTPKGVVALHRGLDNFSRALVDAVGLGPGSRMLQFAPIAFDASALQIFPTLTSGATLVLHPDPAGLASPEILDLCGRRGVTVLDLPAALWRQWVETATAESSRPPRAITVYMTGGEKVLDSVVRQWSRLVPDDARFISSYGPTEATITSTILALTAGEVEALPRADPPLGRPLPGTRVRLLDPHFEPVPLGVGGEIFLSGAGLARGYLNRPGLTAERFVPDPFCGLDGPGGRSGGERLYRTGDLARFLPGGQLQFLGRADHQVKIRGFRVELGEIESALARHPSVREAVVLAREDRPGDRRLVAYLLIREGAEPELAELRGHLAASLPDFMVPAAFVVLPEFPLLPSSKVNRRALPPPDGAQLARRGGAEREAPRTPVEQILAEIWCQVLGVPEIGVFDDFFELGGHSLLATQVITRVRQAFDIDLQLRHVFESSTIAGLAVAILADPARAERVEKTAALRVRLASLSDEEVEAMLMEEAATSPERNPR